jgi:hypothetical protein
LNAKGLVVTNLQEQSNLVLEFARELYVNGESMDEIIAATNAQENLKHCEHLKKVPKTSVFEPIFRL